MNRNVHFKTGIGPILDPMEQPSDIKEDVLRDLSSKLQPIGKAIGLTRAALPDKTALIGFAGAPWTVTTYMAEGGSSRDFTKARLWAWQDKTALHGLLEILIEATVEFLTIQAKAGAEALMLFDSWAGAVPASQRDWLVIKPVRNIIEKLRQNGVDLPVIGFPKGIGEGLIAYSHEAGVTAVGLDHGVDPAWADAYLPKAMPVQGNLDPLSLISGGEAMTADIDYILDCFADRPHIFNLGHGITPATPVNHVQEMIDRVRQR